MLDKDTVERIAVDNGFYMLERENGRRLLIAHPDDEVINGYFAVGNALQAFATALLKEAQAGNEAVVMGYGNYAVGCCKDPETDIEGVIYLPLSESREVGADTSDLFPTGSSQEGYKALIYFKDSKAIQQTIEYLQSISYYKPPTQEVEALKAKLEAVIPVLHEMKMIAPRAIKGGHVFASEFTCVDNALATINNTNELQEPNTGSE